MNSKFFPLVYLLLFFPLAAAFSQNSQKPFKVVIDAGHGGKDPGCIGKLSKEKDVALSVALKTGRLISENCPGVKVIYTRKTDVFVELYRRAEIANSNHADLFISFHCNANDNRNANGIETFVMGLHKSDANQAVARAENSAMLKESNYQNNYDGFNPNSPEAAILFSLYSSAYLNNSILLADKVQKNLVRETRLLNRGVKQAGFWVLYKVAMPSILIEMGFLTNTDDEKYLLSDDNKDNVANAIYQAFASYYTQITGNDVAEKHDNDKTTDNKTSNNDNINDNPADNQLSKTEVPEKEAGKGRLTSPDGVKFMVQFMAMPEKIPFSDSRFKGLPNVNRFHENGLWKYTAGNESTLDDAKKLLKTVKEKYPDAFVIAFDGDEKIPVGEAVKRMK